MRFFARFVVICNICFLLSLVIRFTQAHFNNYNRVVPLPWVDGIIVILGYVIAVVVNAAFVFIVLYRKSIRRHVPVPMIIILFNIIVLPLEIWYLFISKS